MRLAATLPLPCFLCYLVALLLFVTKCQRHAVVGRDSAIAWREFRRFLSLWWSRAPLFHAVAGPPGLRTRSIRDTFFVVWRFSATTPTLHSGLNGNEKRLVPYCLEF